MTDSSSEEAGIEHSAGENSGADDHREAHTTRDRTPPPLGERSESRDSHDDADYRGFLGRFFMVVNQLALHSGIPANCVFGWLSGLLCNEACDRRKNEYHEGGFSHHIRRDEIRDDKKREREQCSEDWSVIYHQMKMSTCKHVLVVLLDSKSKSDA